MKLHRFIQIFSKSVFFGASVIFCPVFSSAMIYKPIAKAPTQVQKPEIAEPCKEKEIGMQFQFRPAFFYPQDKVFRKIYHTSFLPILNWNQDIYEGLLLWSELGYLNRHGHIRHLDLDVPTQVIQVPLSLGFAYRWNVHSFFSIIPSFAATYLYTQTEQHSPYFKPEIIKHTGGFLAGLTFECKIENGFVCDLFLNYRYAKKEIHDRISDTHFAVYLGGIETGIGIGYAF